MMTRVNNPYWRVLRYDLFIWFSVKLFSMNSLSEVSWEYLLIYKINKDFFK